MTAPGGRRSPSETWRGWARRIRTDWRSWLTSRTGGGIITAIIVVALVMTALPGPRPSPSPSASPGASGTPAATSTPAPTVPPEEAWGDLVVPAWEPVAELRAVDSDASGVAVGSAFTLRSRTAVAAVDLAAGLTVEPAFDFRVRPGTTAAEATIVPAEPLVEGAVYRFRLADPTGALAGSWAYRTERPLHVVGSVPGNETTGVPVDTGIEVEFDQDGVAGIDGHFSIEPAVAGRFELHGRTAVFVPTKPLAAATMYRVTISAGVSMTGSDQVLEAPVTFAFETAAASGSQSAWDVGLGRPILEASPTETPVIGVDLAEDDEGQAPVISSLPFEVYRLPSLEAARAAAATLARDPGWGEWASNDLVATTGLAKVATFDGTFESSSPYGYRVVRFPAPLAAGWYLVVVPRDGRDRQALLQVTSLSAFALTSETRSLAWVNDTATGLGIAGATVELPSGGQLGTTGADGLLDVATPAELRTSSTGADGDALARILTVTAPDGRRLLLALGLRSNTTAYDWARNGTSQAGQPDARWWRLLSTDRTTYRTTDVVHAWGLLRSRADGSVPTGMEVTLRTADGSSEAGPWLARVAVTPTARGTWAVDLPITNLPLDGYILEVHAAGVVASSAWLDVAEIRKPAYRIDVTTDVHAVVAGDPVAVTGQALFFDGTPVAGLDLRVSGFGEERTVTTDASGRVALRLTAATEEGSVDYGSISMAPLNPEEGDISGGAAVFVYPSSIWITASGTVQGGRVVLSGSVDHVDLAAIEEVLQAGGWPEDPAGTPAPGTTVTVRVVQLIEVRSQIGTTYDYLEKKVIPTYDYSTRESAVGTYTATSEPDGSISLSIPAPDAAGTYAAKLTARDGRGRTAATEATASPPDEPGNAESIIRPFLGEPGQCGYWSESHAVGDTISLTMHEGDGTVSPAGRYLFVMASDGIRSASLQAGPTFEHVYAQADLPSLSVLAVRFQDGAYILTNEVGIRTKLDDLRLGVEVTADRARYVPGGRASLTIRTTDAGGRPMAADVVVRAIDEKLFELGQAIDIDALADLLNPIGDGLLQSYLSHPLPMPGSGGDCGDTTGGGRDDFRDSALFKLVSTGPDGRAVVAFDLPDDLTSWHVTATAIAADLRSGSGTTLVPVGLPFFADAILAQDYLVGETPVLRVRSFGDDLTAADRVRFTVSAPSLLLPPTTVDAAGLATATLALPPLSLGSHEITISATVIGQPARTDTLVRRIVVRPSRLEIATTQPASPGSAGTVGGSGLTTYVVTDAGRGSLLPTLQDLAGGGGARADRLLAADLARALLISDFGYDDALLAPVDFDLDRYQRDGIALLPYATTSLPLTAMIAIVAPDRIDRDVARFAFEEWATDDVVTRERSIIILAGRAGLGDDVLEDLRAVDISGVTVREALWVALGLLASGDEDGARSIERSLLEQHGQALGPWVRLDVGGSLTETLDAASLLALVTAGTGDPLAASVLRYVHDVRTSDGLYALEELGAIRWTVDRLPRAAARFAWTVDGERHEEALPPGGSWSVALTEAQRAGFRLETIAGSLAVLASWTGTPGPGDLPTGSLVTITRTVTPAADAPTTGLVRVKLHVVFAPTAPTGCWDVSDRTPSGLSPMASVPGWYEDQELDRRPGTWPYEVAGQRVAWCVDPVVDGRDLTLSYVARVVSAGTFTWEPAIVQSATAPEAGATTPVVSYTIR